MITQVTKEIHKFLELHVLELQNNKISIASRYLMNYEKYIKVLSSLNSYIKTIESYIDEVSINDGEHIAPFVIIGSAVDVQDMLTQEKRSIIITETGDGGNEDCFAACDENVSFLSDIGRKLLFKEAGQSILIKRPEIELNWRIDRISYYLNL